MIIDQEKYKSIICLDGDLPISFLKSTSLDIIAVDGAANILFANQIKPTIILGDMDSVDPKILYNCDYIKLDDQDHTDFEKAIFYAKEKNLSPSIIVGMNGGYLDRILMNIGVFSQTDSVFLSEDMICMTVSGEKNFRLPLMTKISIFGVDPSLVTIRGVKWELENAEMAFGKFCSCSNRITSENFYLNVKGKALLFIYLKDVVDSGKVSASSEDLKG